MSNKQKIIMLKHYRNLLLYAKQEKEREELELKEQLQIEKESPRVLALTKKTNVKVA